MQMYLPIAGMPVDPILILVMGGMVGFLSGLFGVGGGFLMTPLLIFVGIPPAIAVGTQANQLVAASISGALAHWRRRSLDFTMASIMLVGGVFGSLIGVWLFDLLQKLGQIDQTISLLYIVFLTSVGSLMVIESTRAMLRMKSGSQTRRKLHQHHFLHGLPLRMRFPRSRLYISALVPGGIGLFGSILVAIMGIGGGFVMVPAMIYLIGMPTALVAGTSLVQIAVVTGIVTVLHAVTTQTVDIMLAALLIVGGVIGAQIGTRTGGRLRGEHARLLLGLLVMAVAVKLIADLLIEPADRYTVSIEITP